MSRGETRARSGYPVLPWGPGSFRLIERHGRVYRHVWLVFISGVAEPLFYLLSVGVGIGGLVGTVAGPGGQAVPYREFVAPGLLAVSALNGAMYDSTFNIYARMKFAKLYDAVLATPIGPGEVALGEVGWAVLRGALYAIAFMLVMLALGLLHTPWALLAIPGAVLISFTVASVGVACTTYMKSWQDFDYVLLVSVPLFLFSAAVPGRRAAARPGARGAVARAAVAGRVPGGARGRGADGGGAPDRETAAGLTS
jgi:lipooligosaccharide transport system permease protein